MNTFMKFGAFALSLALAGCLISEEPLLDAKNGRGLPLAPGLYDVCSTSADDEPDCKKMAVTRDSTGLYRMELVDEDEDVTFARFKRAKRGAWLAQMSSEDDDGYFFFFGKATADAFVLTMMDCGALPESLRKRYVARGDMEVDADATVCTVKALAAAMAAARAYAAPDGPKADSNMVYKRIGDLKE